MVYVSVNGGIGNQLFQYAFGKMLSQYHEVKYDVTKYEYYKHHNGFELCEVFDLHLNYATEIELLHIADVKHDAISKIRRKLFGVNKKTHIVETSKVFNRECVLLDNVYFEGYWQSEDHFYGVGNAVRSDLVFQNVIINQANNHSLFDEIRHNESVSVHIRRGDYIKNKRLGGVCEQSYYDRAFEYIRRRVDSPVFFIFSDDIDWCKRNFGNKYYYIDDSTPLTGGRDMYMMSLCTHNIIANSSFSWWGAWLNKNKGKIVIAPEKWFACGVDYDVAPKICVKL